MQPELFKSAETDGQLGLKILEMLEKSAYKIGIKEISFLLQKEPSHLRDAFNSNGKYFSITWLPTLLRLDREVATDLIDFLCDIAGRKHPGFITDLTPEEELKQIKQKIKDHGLQPLFPEGKYASNT